MNILNNIKLVKKSKFIVNQISKSGELYSDYDLSINRKSDFIKLISDIFGIDNVGFINYKSKELPVVKRQGKKDCILLFKSVTYLGYPHPIFKKRIQIPKSFTEINDNFKNDYYVLFIGVYCSKDNIIFVDFGKDKYILNKANNSSAHIMINDLYQATINGFFSKVDINGNNITTIAYDNFKEYIYGDLEQISDIDIFKIINELMPFDETIYIQDAIQEMYDNNETNWQQMEWGGFYLEHLYKKFIEESGLEEKLVFKTNKSKGELDFDLFFKENKFFGDLKASSDNSTEIPCNDKKAMYQAVEEFGKLWYVIYEHDRMKDSEANNYENVINRNRLVSKLSGKPKDDLSYASKMKTMISYKSMMVIELNKANIDVITTDFNQGKNSNGAPRPPKLKIKKRDLDNFIVYRT